MRPSESKPAPLPGHLQRPGESGPVQQSTTRPFFLAPRRTQSQGVQSPTCSFWEAQEGQGPEGQNKEQRRMRHLAGRESGSRAQTAAGALDSFLHCKHACSLLRGQGVHPYC